MRRIPKYVNKYMRIRSTPLRLNQIYQINNDLNPDKKILQAKFMYKEMPVRLAHRIKELHNLPHDLSNKQGIIKVTDLYIKSLKKIINSPFPTNPDQIHNLALLLNDIKTEHTNLEFDVSNSIKELMDENNNSHKLLAKPDPVLSRELLAKPDPVLSRELLAKPDPVLSRELLATVDKFLDNFYMSRISIRLLISQYYESIINNQAIIRDCNVHDVITDASNQVKEICGMIYPDVPDIEIYGDSQFEFRYIPDHLYYIIFELLKNSARATIENGSTIDPIKIYTSKGTEDMIIKIEDKGMGFSRHKLDKMFNYSYTTSSSVDEQSNNPYVDHPIQIAGFGHGLPLARLHANYFGGDVKIIPYEGIGTDALIYIPRLGNTCEKINSI
jgi:pyruvate dehydrogenase kinase 2/3/4